MGSIWLYLVGEGCAVVFSGHFPMEDIQSWWELPSIAHFCSLFRAAFDLLDFDIEELEEALLTDGLDELGSPLLVELMVRLVQGLFQERPSMPPIIRPTSENYSNTNAMRILHEKIYILRETSDGCH